MCATELNLRNQILDKIHSGWKPAQAFEIPSQDGKEEDKEVVPLAESSADSTSYTSVASFVRNDISILEED